MKKISIFLICQALVMPVFAEDAILKDVDQTIPESSYKFPKGIQFGLGVSSTSGLNGFVGFVNKDFESFWWKRFGFRLDFASTAPVQSSIDSAINTQAGKKLDSLFLNYLNVDRNSFRIGDVGLSVKAHHVATLVDFYPFADAWFAGGWRFTGGYMFGHLGADANLQAILPAMRSGPIEFEISGSRYRYTGNDVAASAGVDWNYSGPYIGTGFDLGIFRGFKMYFDFGTIITNKTPATSLDVPVTNTLQYWNGTTWNALQNNAALRDLLERNKRLAIKKANESLNGINVFPVVKLGFMYRF